MLIDNYFYQIKNIIKCNLHFYLINLLFLSFTTVKKFTCSIQFENEKVLKVLNLIWKFN